jgi:hypothetical protein
MVPCLEDGAHEGCHTHARSRRRLFEMGYTHHFNMLDTDTEFAEMFLQASKIVEIANSSGGQVCILKLNDDMASFTISGTDDDNTCEDFTWPPTPKSFCKTRRFPYDTAVCVCLLVAKRIYQERIVIGSDGLWDDDWSDAKRLYATIFKDEPTCPFDESESESESD